MDDFVQFVVMVLILAVVAVFTWVRKTIEKMSQSGEGGKPVDVAKSVRDQIKKYMQAAGHLDPMSTRPTGVIVTGEGAPAEIETPAPAKPAREVFRPAPETPKPVVVEEKRRLTQRTSLKDRMAVAGAPHERAKTGFVLDRRDVRRGIILAELLGPPMADRKDYRLF